MLATNSLDTPVIGVSARRDGGHFYLRSVRQRLEKLQMSRPAAAFGIVDDLALFGGVIAGPASLAAFAGDAPLNTDDHAVVSYLARRITYAPTSTPRDRLLELVASVGNSPEELLAGADNAWSARLAAYWHARDEYLESGRRVRPSYDVREPLLAVLSTSRDFRPAYDPLLQMAGALAATDSDGAVICRWPGFRAEQVRAYCVARFGFSFG
jgi:spermidine synthase